MQNRKHNIKYQQKLHESVEWWSATRRFSSEMYANSCRVYTVHCTPVVYTCLTFGLMFICFWHAYNETESSIKTSRLHFYNKHAKEMPHATQAAFSLSMCLCVYLQLSNASDAYRTRAISLSIRWSVSQYGAELHTDERTKLAWCECNE